MASYKKYFILVVVKIWSNLNKYCYSYWIIFNKIVKWKMVSEPSFRTFKHMFKSFKSQKKIIILIKKYAII
jgi:hypothetical protein